MPSRTMTNKQLQDVHGALKVLGNRKMALVTGDLKVARLLKALTPMADPIAVAKQRLITDALEGVDIEKVSALQVQSVNAGIRTEEAKLDAEEVAVELPEIVITEDDLPKEQKGEDGWKNAAGLGAIISDLDFLFQFKE